MCSKDVVTKLIGSVGDEKFGIGIIGGSGLNSLDFLKDVKSVCKKESNSIYDNILFGYYNRIRVLYIPRHGFFHEYSPSRVPYKSMMCALKNLGCTHIIATTAVLSLNSNMKPGDFVIIDSLIDCTENRENTFHREHPCSCDELLLPTKGYKPFSEGMSRILKIKADSLGIPCHLGGVVITVEGPRFPSPAESGLYANFGADILNFTTVPEVILARELEMHYVAIAMITDFDPLFDSPKRNIDVILSTFQQNVENLKCLLKNSLLDIASADWTKENTN
ncbi:hypothetical protein J437_LFUL006775, partial [Ladona fulva]